MFRLFNYLVSLRALTQFVTALRPGRAAHKSHRTPVLLLDLGRYIINYVITEDRAEVYSEVQRFSSPCGPGAIPYVHCFHCTTEVGKLNSK